MNPHDLTQDLAAQRLHPIRQRLAALMIKHRVGIQVKQIYSAVEVNKDFLA